MTRPVTTFDFTTRDIDRHQAAVAHLTGICPKCGDAGWWIDDEFPTNSDFHYCDCPRGIAEREKAAAEDAEAQREAEREQQLKERLAREEEQPLRRYLHWS